MISRSLEELFVDRLEEIRKFRRSLDGASGRRIILVSAGPGMGKSWLLRRFAQEAAARGGAHALIDFSDGQAYDVLALVRRFRDLLGPAHFNRLTAAINDATAPRIVVADQGGAGARPAVSLAGAQTGDVQFGDVAGGSIIKDNLFVLQSDNPLLLQAIEDRVTQVFFESLEAVTAAGSVLFLFDSYERTSQEGERWVSNAADRWIQRELLQRINDGRLPGVVVVLAGRRLPPPLSEPAWAKVVGALPLALFTVGDVAEYLRQNRRLAALSDAEVQTLYNAVQGNPQLLGIIGDNLERSSATGPPDDDW